MVYNKLLKKISNAILVAIFWLGVWHLCALWVDSDLLIAAPMSVFKILCKKISTFSFWQTIFYTFMRIIIGFLFAIIIAIPMAILCEKFSTIKLLFSPIISIIRSTPVASFILFLLVWCKNKNVPIIIVFLMVMPLIWTNITQGIQNTDKKLLEMARVFKFSQIKTIKYIYLPGIKPYFISSILSGVGLAWKSGVAAEVLCTPNNAIGTQIHNAKIYLETPELFAWTITVIFISLIIETTVAYALNKSNRGLKNDKNQ